MAMSSMAMSSMAMSSAFGESRGGCKYKRQAHGSSGCGPKNLLVVTIESDLGVIHELRWA